MIDRDRLDVGNLHRILGIIMALVFVGMGAYMQLAHNYLANVDETQLLLFRSIHIYLLLSSLVNLVLGIHYWIYPRRTLRALQNVGSTLVALAPILFLLGFFNEPWLDGVQRPFTRPGVYAIAIGSLLHVVAFYWNFRLQEATEQGNKPAR